LILSSGFVATRSSLEFKENACEPVGFRVALQFGCGTRILRVIHGRDARATG